MWSTFWTRVSDFSLLLLVNNPNLAIFNYLCGKLVHVISTQSIIVSDASSGCGMESKADQQLIVYATHVRMQ